MGALLSINLPVHMVRSPPLSCVVSRTPVYESGSLGQSCIAKLQELSKGNI